MASKKRSSGQLTLSLPDPEPKKPSVSRESEKKSVAFNVTSLEEARRNRSREVLISNLRQTGLLSLRSKA